jgi:hypothetical protein
MMMQGHIDTDLKWLLLPLLLLMHLLRRRRTPPCCLPLPRLFQPAPQHQCHTMFINTNIVMIIVGTLQL